MYLTEITIKDGLIHQGIFFKPKTPRKRALLWIHGLTSNFYGNVKRIDTVVTACEKNGIGFASFNNRGHDMFASTHKVDPQKRSVYSYVTIGSGNEAFEECIDDIDAGIEFLVKEGFTEIFLVGSSTGANKAAFYSSTRKHKNLKGVVLLSPISDRLFAGIAWYKIVYLKILVALGLGEKIISSGSYFPGTPKRFLSLITPKSPEDIFDYGDAEPCLVQFSKISIPILLLLGGADTLADRSIETIKMQYDTHQKSSLYKSHILADANHGFDGIEKELIELIMHWIKEV